MEVKEVRATMLKLRGILIKNTLDLHVCRANQWDLAASSSPMFATVNPLGTVPPANGIGGGSGSAGLQWYHAVALKGFPVLDAINNKEGINASKKNTLFYYEVSILDVNWRDRYHAVGLSAGYTKDFADHVGQHPNSYGLDAWGHAYYVCGEIHHTNANENAPLSWEDGMEDIYGFGLLVKPNKELAIFGTIDGMLLDPLVPIQFCGGEFLYPTVSVAKMTTKVKANFGNDPAVPFRYNIAACPGLVLEG